MKRPDFLIDELHQGLARSRGARKLPPGLREDWSQQVWLELLDLWDRFANSGGAAADFPGFAEVRLPRRLRAWWNKNRQWDRVTLIPEYDPDAFVVEEHAPIELVGLTPGEAQVWRFLVRGYRPKEIAVMLGKSYPAVRQTLSRIYRKQH